MILWKIERNFENENDVQKDNERWKKLCEQWWESQGKSKEIVKMMIKKSKEIELWEWWWSILISDSVVTAPSQAGPILTILSFVPFALIDDEESDCFEKDDDNDRKEDSFQHRHEIVLILSVGIERVMF